MKKKEYEKPQMKAIEIMNEQAILAASGTPGFGEDLDEDGYFE